MDLPVADLRDVRERVVRESEARRKLVNQVLSERPIRVSQETAIGDDPNCNAPRWKASRHSFLRRIRARRERLSTSFKSGHRSGTSTLSSNLLLVSLWEVLGFESGHVMRRP